MRRAIKYIVKILLGIIVSIILYLIIGIILSRLSTNPSEINCERKDEIYLVSNGIHLDFIIPKELLKENLLKELKVPNRAKYVSFGWGDKGFYLETPRWKDLKFSIAIRAIFLKSESAMHVDFYYSKSNSWNSVKICDEQYDKLIKYVMDTFKRNNEGEIIEIEGYGYFEEDKFYEANGSYSFIKTCNNWVNNGLKQSKVKTSIWSPFDYGVLFHVKKESEKIDN